ncbi:MAG: cytochrome c biogenesis protein CcsA [Duodenibacillus sp.]|nr:cytochrome c biogenesis protein CcsA [Duodenibacillus sp.]
MKAFFNPESFYPLAGRLVRPLFVIALALAAAGFYTGFFVAPIDATQGQSYRIIFIHVASAWMSMLIYVMMALFAGGALATGNRMCSVFAAALAPTGAIMAFLACFTGAFWGRPTWGAYWVWDARLTSELILLFLYLGFLALQSSIADVKRADQACAVIAIVGVVNVPIIYFSVRWWNTLHQGASITARGSSIASTMLAALLIMVAAFWIYSFAATLARARTIVLERCWREAWAAKAALKGEI